MSVERQIDNKEILHARQGGRPSVSSLKEVERYAYEDEHGNILFYSIRYEPKTFRQARPDGKGGLIFSIKGVRQVPYRLPRIIKSSGDQVFIVEGEKDVHTLEKFGFIATTNAGGAGKWSEDFDQFFENKDIYIIADNDLAGRRHAHDVANKLSKVAKTIKIIDLSEYVEDKGDVTDFLNSHSIDELKTLVEETQYFNQIESSHKESKEREEILNTDRDELYFSTQEEIDAFIKAPPAPEAIIDSSIGDEFPIEHLPALIRDAVQEVYDFVQSPLPIVASSALANLAAAMQTCFSVKRDDAAKDIPLSMYFASIAESGERKTATDRLFSAGYKKFLEENEDLALKDHARFLSEKEVYDAEMREKKRQLEKELKAGNLAAVSALKDDIQKIIENEPFSPPQRAKILIKDATLEALEKNLAEKCPSVLVSNNEGGSFLSSYSMSKEKIVRTLAGYNSMWDGETKSIDRVTREDQTIIKNARVSASLMVQPKILKRFLSESGDISVGSGFFPRFLICQPPSKIGTRSYVDPGNMPALERYSELIKKAYERGWIGILRTKTGFKISTETIDLDERAKLLWVHLHDSIERSMLNKFSDIKEFASKAAENILRLAANFAAIRAIESDSKTVTISEKEIESAFYVVYYYLMQAKKIFGDSSDMISDFLEDAIKIEKTIIRKIKEKGTYSITMHDIYRTLYNTRGFKDNKAKIIEILHFLFEKKRVVMKKMKKSIVIFINPLILKPESHPIDTKIHRDEAAAHHVQKESTSDEIEIKEDREDKEDAAACHANSDNLYSINMQKHADVQTDRQITSEIDVRSPSSGSWTYICRGCGYLRRSDDLTACKGCEQKNREIKAMEVPRSIFFEYFNKK